ncbi:hypothetical protein D3C87_2051470 [compost metagenome]
MPNDSASLWPQVLLDQFPGKYYSLAIAWHIVGRGLLHFQEQQRLLVDLDRFLARQQALIVE